MNTYTRALRDGPESSALPRGHRTAKKPWFFGFAIKVILMCACIFGAVTCRIGYNAKIGALNKEATMIRARIQHINLINANLRDKREQLTAYPHIAAKIEKYKLGLRAADYRQISYIKILDLPHEMHKESPSGHFVSVSRHDGGKKMAMASIR